MPAGCCASCGPFPVSLERRLSSTWSRQRCSLSVTPLSAEWTNTTLRLSPLAASRDCTIAPMRFQFGAVLTEVPPNFSTTNSTSLAAPAIVALLGPRRALERVLDVRVACEWEPQPQCSGHTHPAVRSASPSAVSPRRFLANAGDNFDRQADISIRFSFCSGAIRNLWERREHCRQ